MVLRVVIDSNCLQSDELRSFLAVSVENYAVLTDYAWMEAYKGQSILSIQKSMAVLKDYPQQVIVLKGTKSVSALDPRAPGIAQRMYWSRRGREFYQTVEGLEQAAAGHLGALQQIAKRGNAADQHMEKLLADVEDLPNVFFDLMRTFLEDEEISLIRSGRPYSPSIIRKFFRISDRLALNLYKSRHDKVKFPTIRSKYNSFIFRFSMAAVIYFVGWIKTGSQIKKSAEKFRNDTIDLNFATYGTYFNGVMSNDKRVQEIYLELRFILEAAQAKMPEGYLAKFREQLEVAQSAV